MKLPITESYLNELRAKLIAAEDDDKPYLAQACRDDYRTACAAAYSSGLLTFIPDTTRTMTISEVRKDGIGNAATLASRKGIATIMTRAGEKVAMIVPIKDT